jgi:hypothetical protein
VPSGARVSLVASLCWDPEPAGVLGGDSAPSNLAASLPTIDRVWTFTVDGNGDGRPDLQELSGVPTAPAAAIKLWPPVPNPFNPLTSIRFEVPSPAAAGARLVVFDLRGRRIATLHEGPLSPGAHTAVWNGYTDSGRPAAAGTYICELRCAGQAMTRSLSLVK